MLELPQPLIEQQDRLEQALRDHLAQAASGGLPLYRMMQYQLGWVDKDGLDETSAPTQRLLGALCLEATTALRSGGRQQSLGALAAVAVELFHQSVAVHEDMQVAEPHSEGRSAVWWVWGPAQAINVGDGLHALARLAVFRLKDDGLTGEQALSAVSALDAMALRYYEGQYLELVFQERVDITESQYLQMASAKRGALFAGALGLGAQVGGASDQQAEVFRRAGEKLGIAAQIREDVQPLWGAAGGVGAGRLLNKSKLYPIVHALETGPISRKRALGGIYFKRVLEPADVDALRGILNETDARAHASAQAEAYATEALTALEQAGVTGEALARWHTIARGLAGDAGQG